MKKLISALFLSLTLASCASMNDSLTPSLKVTKDPFDSTVTLSQKPVSSSGLSEDWHTLGFTWKESTPDIVYLTVGTQGIDNVSGVQFMVDGKLIKTADTASVNTKYGDWSTRRFYIPIDDFKLIATANLIKMKVIHIDTYTVSSFGEGAGMARIINSKFKPFIEALNKQLKL